jgi:hypothetical protein
MNRFVKPFKISRRSVLKGAAGVAIGLPWLEAMTRERTARANAAGSTPKRFLAVYWPGGTVPEKWQPTGTENAFTLSPILSPLEPVKSSILIPTGLRLMCGDQTQFSVEQSQGGMVGWLTGQVQQLNQPNFVNGPSIDQVLAPRLSAGKPYGSLGMAVRWGTGKSHRKLTPMDVCQFGATSPVQPIPPRLDPHDIWNTLFGAPPRPDAARAWETSILDAVDKRYVKLGQRLGAADRQRLDAHLERVRDLEKRIGTMSVSACASPVLVDTTGYNPTSGLNSADDGSITDLSTDAAIPKVGKLMMDMIVMAFACDKTNVAYLQWSDSEAKYTLPWLGLPEHHNYYENSGGYRPAELEKIYTWYSSQHAYLLQQLASIDLGGHSMLDETLAFFGTEVAHPATHTKKNMPFLLAGGGLRTGRWVQYADDPPHNNLLVSLLNIFGDPSTTFGDPRCCTGALPNLV